MFLNAKWRSNIGKLQKATAVLNVLNTEKADEPAEPIKIEAPAEVRAPETKNGDTVGAVVTAVHVKVGDLVSPGACMIEVEDTRPVRHPGQPSKATIFNALDTDQSGALGKEELVEVLAAWGVPRLEAERCFEKLDDDSDGVCTREEFYDKYEPIWQYQLSRVKNAIDKHANFASQEAKRLDKVSVSPSGVAVQQVAEP